MQFAIKLNVSNGKFLLSLRHFPFITHSSLEDTEYAFEVVDTLPILQGVVTSSTTVVIVDPSDFPSDSPQFSSITQAKGGFDADDGEEEDEGDDDEDSSQDGESLYVSSFLSPFDGEEIVTTETLKNTLRATLLMRPAPIESSTSDDQARDPLYEGIPFMRFSNVDN